MKKHYEGRYKIICNLPEREGADYADLAKESRRISAETLMFGGCFGVVVTCCMVTAKRSDQELGDMMKEKREGTVMQCENETM